MVPGKKTYRTTTCTPSSPPLRRRKSERGGTSRSTKTNIIMGEDILTKRKNSGRVKKGLGKWSAFHVMERISPGGGKSLFFS